MANNIESDLPAIISELRNKFGIEELKLLATTLSYDFEDFKHDKKIELAHDLSLTCKRDGKLLDLINAAISMKSIFNLFPINYFEPDTLFDWMIDKNMPGEMISNDTREKIITDHYKFQSIGFLEKGFKIAKRVCMLRNETDHFSATGFFIDKKTILTNKHVLSSEGVSKNTDAWLNFEADTSRSTLLNIKKLNSKSYIPSEGYDLAICSIDDEVSDFTNDFPHINYGKPIKDDTIPIIQHPKGLPKQICIGHNSLKYINGTRIQYLTDTLPGSSGSPVFNSEWDFIGLHALGGNIVEPRTHMMVFRNEGIHINAIKKFLESNGYSLI